MKTIKKVLTLGALTALATTAPAISSTAQAQSITAGYNLQKKTPDVRIEHIAQRGPVRFSSLADLSGKEDTLDIESIYGMVRARTQVAKNALIPAPTVRYEGGSGRKDQLHFGLSSVLADTSHKIKYFAIAQGYASTAKKGLRATVYGEAALDHVKLSLLYDRDQSFDYIEAHAIIDSNGCKPFVRIRKGIGRETYSIGLKFGK